MSEPENAQGQVLTDNIGTPERMMEKGLIDEIKFSNLTGDEYDFITLCELGKYLGIKPLEIAENAYLRCRVGTNALGLRYVIRGELARKSVASSVSEEIPQRPNVLARHLWARDKEKEYQEYKEQMGINDK